MNYQSPKPSACIHKAHRINQALFYCYNASSERVPVGIFSGFIFKDDQTLLFTTNYFPVVEMCRNSFAAELHFYKKKIAGSCVLEGMATMRNDGSVVFIVEQGLCTGKEQEYRTNSFFASLIQPYIFLYKKSVVFLMYPFRKKAPAGVFQ